MKTVFLAGSALCLVCIVGSAFAGPLDTATFRLKVASCTAQSKDAGVKKATPNFYTYMSSCLDRVTVAVNVQPAAAK